MADEKKHKDKTDESKKDRQQPGDETSDAGPSTGDADVAAASGDTGGDDTNVDDVDGEDGEGDEPVAADPAGPDDGDDDSGEAAADADTDPAAVRIWGRTGAERLTLSEDNAAIHGTAVLHCQSRSFSVRLDGDAGIRLLYRVLRGRTADWAADRLHPVHSSARDAWLVLADTDHILAIEWHPGLPADASRGVAIDPAV